jgi:glycosyltransferase involved in cell wall biosynthesis
MMKVAFLYNAIPNREHSTATYCAFLLLKAMVDRNCDVQAVLLLSQDSSICDDATSERWLEELKKLMITIHVLPWETPKLPSSNFIRKLTTPRVVDFFPQATLMPRLSKFLKGLSPDVIFIWGNWPVLAAIYGADIAPKFAFMGDLPFESVYYRSRTPFVSKIALFSPKILYSRTVIPYALRKITIRMLSRCNFVALTAAHYAEKLRRLGLSNCRYLPNIVPDWGGEDWLERRQQCPANNRFKILLVGHVESTANLSGLYLFADKILRILNRRLGDSFEVHICGKGEVPRDLRTKLAHPLVYLRGFVDDIVSELLNSDVFLVSTPIKVGVRVRIAYAWSLGCCVVAHQSNISGLPELRNGENALLASNGEGLAYQVIKAYDDRGLRLRLGFDGRKTYENHFSYRVTTTKIFNELERLISKKSSN